MFTDEIAAAAGAAKAKTGLLKRSLPGYFVSAVLAGIYVGFGVLLAFTVGGLLAGEPYARIAQGAVFGIALSLVVMAGAELFTGNVMTMTVGAAKKSVTAWETLKLLIICYIGNWVGAALLAAMFFAAGLTESAAGAYMAAAAEVKMNLPFVELFFRAVLCNFLVCLAVWCTFRCKSESGKLIMIFWCLFAFVTTGFEHSVANMTLLTVSLLAPSGAAVDFGGYFYNILVSTLGNIAGGALFVAAPYLAIAGKKE